MPNITLSVDDAIVRKVRKLAVDRNTTVTAMVRDCLTRVANQDEATPEQAVTELRETFVRSSVDMGPRTWTREGLHER